MLSLTESGRKVLDIAPDGADAQFQLRFVALQDREQSMLIAALERVAAMISDDDPAAAAVLDASDIVSERPVSDSMVPDASPEHGN